LKNTAVYWTRIVRNMLWNTWQNIWCF